MLFPDSLPGLIRMTHRFARRVVHPWTVPPWGGSSSGGSISTVVAGCDEEPHPGPRQVGRCDEFGGAVDRPACEPGRRLEMWAQFSVTLVVVVGIAVTLLPIIAAILMLLSPGGRRPAGSCWAGWRRSSSRSCCSLLLVVGAAPAGLLRPIASDRRDQDHPRRAAAVLSAQAVGLWKRAGSVARKDSVRDVRLRSTVSERGSVRVQLG
jgi:hypothetical protein